MLKYILLIIGSILLCNFGSADTLYVNETGWYRSGEVFNTTSIPIQLAINNATTNDIVYIWNGSYTENIDITTASITIEGEDKDIVNVTATLISDHVFYVAATNVTIKKITVTGATNSGKGGITHSNADYSTIDDVSSYNNYYGLYIDSTDYIIIKNSILNLNIVHGCYFADPSTYNIIEHCNVSSNDYFGITLYSCNHNTINNNTLINNTNAGIHHQTGINNTISNCNILNNDNKGIYLTTNSANNTFINNLIKNNNPGIQLQDTINTTIENNNISLNSAEGLLIWSSDNTTLKNSTVSANTGYGIYIYDSENTICINNSVDDTSGSYTDYYITSSSLNNIIRNPFNIYNYIKIGATSDCTVEFTDSTIFIVDNPSKYIEYYPSISNLILTGTDTYRIDKYNGTLVPKTTFLKNVSINSWNESFGYNISVNSSNVTEICTYTTNVINATDIYSCLIDGIWNQNIYASNKTVSWTYDNGFSFHNLNIKWNSTYTPPEGYIPPDPTNLQNTTGDFWINHTWQPGAGNVTDSYNISENNVWQNGTINTYWNITYGYGNDSWQNITMWAYNNSDIGSLSTGSISQNTQLLFTNLPTNLQKTYDHTWINWTWNESFLGTHLVDSYNVSINGTWNNGTTNHFYNHTNLTYESTSSIVVHGYNNTQGLSIYHISGSYTFPIHNKMVKAIEQLVTPIQIIKDKFFNIIPFIISIILFAGFGLALMVMTSRLKKW